jgi:hypothetical protein
MAVVLLGRHRPSNALRQQPRAELHHAPSAAQPVPPWVALSPACAGSHGIVPRWVALSTAYARGAQRRACVGVQITWDCALTGELARRVAPSMRGRSNRVGSRSQRRTRRCAWRSILRWPRSQRRTRRRAPPSMRAAFKSTWGRALNGVPAGAHGVQSSVGRALNGELARRAPPSMRAAFKSRGPRSHGHIYRLAWHSPTLGRALSGICPRCAAPTIRGAFNHVGRALNGICTGSHGIVLRWVALSPVRTARSAEHSWGVQITLGCALNGELAGSHGILSYVGVALSRACAFACRAQHSSDVPFLTRWVALSTANSHGARRRACLGRSNPVGSRSQRRTRTARAAEHAWGVQIQVGSRSQRRTRRCA